MELSSTEIKILRLIRKEYPIPHDPTDKHPIGIVERPLLTEEAIVTKCKGMTPGAVTHAVNRLTSFQCIAKVYLMAESEYVDQLAGARTIRHVVLGPRTGHNCFQVTTFGCETLDGCLREQLKRVVLKWVSKVSEEYVPLVIAFFVGMLISSFFGFDIKQLRQ